MSDLDSTTEIEYRDVPGFPGYRAGSDGSLWSCRGMGRGPALTGVWKRMKPVPNRHRNNYLYAVLCSLDGRHVMKTLHCIVLESFVGPRPQGMHACHFPDHDPANCRLENLRWDTPQNNQADTIKMGRQRLGENCPWAKLTAGDVREIRRLRASGVPVADVAAKFGIHVESVTRIANRRSWTHLV